MPLKDFEQLKHDAEMLDDIRAYDAAMSKKEEMVPSEVADRRRESHSGFPGTSRIDPGAACHGREDCPGVSG